MARTLSAIPQVRRQDISTTARPGVDKLGPSGIAREWQNKIRLRTHASTSPKTEDHQEVPPSQEYFKSSSVDRGCPRPPRRSNSGTDRHHRGCVRDQQQAKHHDKRFYLLAKVKSSNQQTKHINRSYNNKQRAKPYCLFGVKRSF